jgi:DNA-directed RNA polymerase subunit RPC12/RpoP
MTVPHLRFGLLLQYFCSSCGKILKDRTLLVIQNQQIKEEEECPNCGALLLETLQNRMVSTSVSQQPIVTNAIPKSLQDLSVEFRTALHQIEDSSVKLAFDIEKIDSLLNLKLMGVFVLSVSIGTPRF